MLHMEGMLMMRMMILYQPGSKRMRPSIIDLILISPKRKSMRRRDNSVSGTLVPQRR